MRVQCTPSPEELAEEVQLKHKASGRPWSLKLLFDARFYVCICIHTSRCFVLGVYIYKRTISLLQMQFFLTENDLF